MARRFLTDAELAKILEEDSGDENGQYYDGDSDLDDLEFENLSDQEHDHGEFVDDNIEREEEESETVVNIPEDEEVASDSEQNLSGNNLDDDNDDDFTIYRSKSGFLWVSKPPGLSKRRAHNKVTAKPGLTNTSKDITSIREAFDLFMPRSMMDKICEETNRHCQRLLEGTNKNIPPVTTDELYAFVGILLAAGKSHGRKLPLDELWTRDIPYRQPFFTAAMSRDRFRYLLSNIRFDDRETRVERIEQTQDKLEAIRTVFDQFSEACSANYSPGLNITVDERLATFRGNCPFRVYMKNKPGRYGIKIWVVSDSETAYILDLQVYTGMVNGVREINQGRRVVTDLVNRYYGSWRGVTCDNFFTSIPLATELYTHKLTITGTLRSNKPEIPKAFLPSKNRDNFSSLFGFTDKLTLVSYVPKKNRAVALLSTQFNDGKIDHEDEKKKPENIKHYNQTKGAVDTGDKMTQEYTCARATRRWPFRIFMEMIDISALNAYIIWTKKNPQWKHNNRSRRRVFLKELALDLVRDNVKSRKESDVHFHKFQKYAMKLICQENENSIEEATATEAARPANKFTGRCSFCPRKKDRKSKVSCNICKKFVCIVHRVVSSTIYCVDCNVQNPNN